MYCYADVIFMYTLCVCCTFTDVDPVDTYSDGVCMRTFVHADWI